MGPILTLALKDLRLMARDRVGLFFTMGFPVVFAVFFGTVFAGGSEGGGGIRIVVVDQDQSDGSKAFVKLLEEAPELMVARPGEGEPAFTPESAADLVRRGRQSAYVLIPPGFGRRGGMMFWDPGDGGRRLEFGVDPSRRAEAGMLEGVLTRYAFQQLSSLFSDPAAMRRELTDTRRLLSGTEDLEPTRRTLLDTMLAGIDGLFADLETEAKITPESGGVSAGFSPIRVERKDIAVRRAGPPNSYALTFAQALLWGLAGCAASFGMSLVQERTRGTLLRLRVAPLSWGQVIASKAAACFIASIVVCAILVAFAIIVFGVRPASSAMLALAVVCNAVCFVGLMMLLAVLGRSEAAAGAIGWAVILPLMMLGGGMVPTFAMPRWMQAMGQVSPMHWGILAAEGGLWRGLSLAEMALPCGILLGVGAVGFLLGVRLFRLTETGE